MYTKDDDKSKELDKSYRGNSNRGGSKSHGGNRSRSKGKDSDFADYRSRGKRNQHRTDRKGNNSSQRNKDSKYSTMDESEVRGNNDPKWYEPDEVVMQQAAGWSFANYLGVPALLEHGELDIASTLLPDTHEHIGSIMVMDVNPSVGKVYEGAKAKTSAINQQGFKMYSRLSSVNSKNTMYGPQDVTTLMLAVGELISMVSWIQRTFGMTWVYNVRNRTMPTYLIKASGFDPSDFYSHLAQYRIRFNTILVQANKIPFPTNINYFQKCSQLFSSIYKDSEDDMSQMYLFRPHSTWDINETASQGTQLVTHVYPFAFDATPGAATDIDYAKMSDILDILEDKVNDLLLSATYNYIYADILNYSSRPVGNTNTEVMHFGTIAEDYAVLPVYNPDILMQINNATILGNPVKDAETIHAPGGLVLKNTPNNDVLPDEVNLCLQYHPAWRHAVAPWWSYDKYLNFHSDPDLNARIEATRLVAGVEFGAAALSGGGYVGMRYTGSDHYITNAIVLTDGTKGYQWTLNSSCVDSYAGNELLNFREAPMLYRFTAPDSGSTHSFEYKGVYGELDHFTTISNEVMSKINDLSLYGLFEPKDFEYAGLKPSNSK